MASIKTEQPRKGGLNTNSAGEEQDFQLIQDDDSQEHDAKMGTMRTDRTGSMKSKGKSSGTSKQ